MNIHILINCTPDMSLLPEFLRLFVLCPIGVNGTFIQYAFNSLYPHQLDQPVMALFTQLLSLSFTLWTIADKIATRRNLKTKVCMVSICQGMPMVGNSRRSLSASMKCLLVRFLAVDTGCRDTSSYPSWGASKCTYPLLYPLYQYHCGDMALKSLCKIETMIIQNNSKRYKTTNDPHAYPFQPGPTCL